LIISNLFLIYTTDSVIFESSSPFIYVYSLFSFSLIISIFFLIQIVFSKYEQFKENNNIKNTNQQIIFYFFQKNIPLFRNIIIFLFASLLFLFFSDRYLKQTEISSFSKSKLLYEISENPKVKKYFLKKYFNYDLNQQDNNSTQISIELFNSIFFDTSISVEDFSDIKNYISSENRKR